MANFDANRLPQDTVLGLIQSTLDEDPLPPLGDDAPYGSAPGDLVVRFTSNAPMSSAHFVVHSHWIVALGVAASVSIGIALLFLT